MDRPFKIEALILWGTITLALRYQGWPAWATPLLPSLWINLPLISLAVRREPLRDWGLVRPAPARAARHIAAFILVVVPGSLLALRLSGAIDFAWQLDAAAISRSLVHQLVWVALPEEIFFRGYLWQRLQQEADPAPTRTRLILANATLFAITHYLIHPGGWALATWLPGLYFAWLRCRTGTVTLPILCHALANTVLFTATGRLG
jgi:membrane protease YdiL (CAAX protease family)